MDLAGEAAAHKAKAELQANYGRRFFPKTCLRRLASSVIASRVEMWLNTLFQSGRFFMRRHLECTTTKRPEDRKTRRPETRKPINRKPDIIFLPSSFTENQYVSMDKVCSPRLISGRAGICGGDDFLDLLTACSNHSDWIARKEQFP